MEICSSDMVEKVSTVLTIFLNTKLKKMEQEYDDMKVSVYRVGVMVRVDVQPISPK